MWVSRRFIGATAAAPLCVARRCMHPSAPSTMATPDAAPSSSSSFSSAPSHARPAAVHGTETAQTSPEEAPTAPSSSTKAVQLDDTDDWILSQMQRSVDSGRQTNEAASYFREIMHDQPEFHQCLQEARRLMGGQEPERLTRYQQGQFADRLCNYMSGIASDKLRRAHAEEQTTKRYTQDGTPTGENYWFEAGNTLSSPAVPGFVKDEILQEMQQERAAKSPAFEHPPEEAQMAGEDDGYAAHLRRQRSKMMNGVDFS